MAKKVFVSFDFDNDKRYKYLMEAWDANPDFEFEFTDNTPREINSDNVAQVKAALTTKINQSSHTLVIVGIEANDIHTDTELIGYRNWINFEVAKSKISGNKLVGIKIDKDYSSPEELLGSGASWAMSFTQDAILKAIDNA